MALASCISVLPNNTFDSLSSPFTPELGNNQMPYYHARSMLHRSSNPHRRKLQSIMPRSTPFADYDQTLSSRNKLSIAHDDTVLYPSFQDEGYGSPTIGHSPEQEISPTIQPVVKPSKPTTKRKRGLDSDTSSTSPKRQRGGVQGLARRASMVRPLSEVTAHLTHIPIKDTSAWVHRSRAVRLSEVSDSGSIKRPSNSFILYRSAYADRCRELEKSNNHVDISTTSGASWAIESTEIRKRYEDWARIERRNHLNAFPGYSFHPTSQESAQRKRKAKDKPLTEKSSVDQAKTISNADNDSTRSTPVVDKVLVHTVENDHASYSSSDVESIGSPAGGVACQYREASFSPSLVSGSICDTNFPSPSGSVEPPSYLNSTEMNSMSYPYPWTSIPNMPNIPEIPNIPPPHTNSLGYSKPTFQSIKMLNHAHAMRSATSHPDQTLHKFVDPADLTDTCSDLCSNLDIDAGNQTNDQWSTTNIQPCVNFQHPTACTCTGSASISANAGASADASTSIYPLNMLDYNPSPSVGPDSTYDDYFSEDFASDDGRILAPCPMKMSMNTDLNLNLDMKCTGPACPTQFYYEPYEYEQR